MGAVMTVFILWDLYGQCNPRVTLQEGKIKHVKHKVKAAYLFRLWPQDVSVPLQYSFQLKDFPTQILTKAAIFRGIN